MSDTFRVVSRPSPPFPAVEHLILPCVPWNKEQGMTRPVLNPLHCRTVWIFDFDPAIAAIALIRQVFTLCHDTVMPELAARSKTTCPAGEKFAGSKTTEAQMPMRCAVRFSQKNDGLHAA
jgi:hypothetical protein